MIPFRFIAQPSRRAFAFGLATLIGITIGVSFVCPARAQDTNVDTPENEEIVIEDVGEPADEDIQITPEPDLSPGGDIPEAPEDPLQPPDPDDIESGQAETPSQPTAAALQSSREAEWRDIAAMPRKPFLKRRRLEVNPFIGSTLNDTLIQHTAVGGSLNYYLTDVLAIGAEGMYYFSNVLDDEFLVRYHFRRVPSLNKYKFTASFNFSYTPIYGKFTILNRPIFHYDLWISGGVGVTGTEIIPRDIGHESFSNIALTFPVGIGTRLFLNDWLALHLVLRDYMMLDTFEAAGRDIIDGDTAKEDQSVTRFVNNVVLSAGVSIYFPFGFEYSTYR